MRSVAERPSAALVLGVFAGIVAAVAVIPTAVPFRYQLDAADEAVAFTTVTASAEALSLLPRPDEATTIDLARRLQVGRIVWNPSSPPAIAPAAAHPLDGVTCDGPSARWVRDAEGERWAVACSEGRYGTVLVGRLAPHTAATIAAPYLVLLLATVSGLVTALGILRLLAPLSRMAAAIGRISTGERGIRLDPVGLRELDEVIQGVNDAAVLMEEREESIMGRMRAIQEMARMVAHEVRNPLQSLELLTSLIAAENDANERHDLAKAIHTEIRSLDMVVNRVLREGASQVRPKIALSRTQQPLGPILQHVATLRRPECKAHGIALDVRCPNVQAEVDGALLGRSIENLVLNAMQAIRSHDGRIEVSVEDAHEDFVVLVEDNGIGVDPALAAHIFEPNVTGRTGGTGLGLALVREVIHAHGGTIRHERSPLGGARFVARIPKRTPT